MEGLHKMASEKIIKFTADRDVHPDFWPTPISAKIPNWWKDMASYGGFAGTPKDQKIVQASGELNATIKRCVPILDSLSSGYVIVTHKDIFVKISGPKDANDPTDIGSVEFIWPHGDNAKAVEGHSYGQASEHPMAKPFNGRDIFKYINPWHIETPPGYSTLFVPPMNNPNGYFTALPGVVDTDMYTNVVNFPFVIEKADYEGIIPAGTPVVQVFPFKRDSWQMEIGGEKELTIASLAQQKFSAYIGTAYKRFFWSRKEYK
jgi:hypothetical protein